MNGKMVQRPPADMPNANDHYEHAGVEFTLQGLLLLDRTNTSTESEKKSRLALNFVLKTS